ncbi:MAG: ABC transporter ATP-binding protein [Bacillota bacterium]|jgi:ABC-2 type transport system ATP-binding protein|nr:ABC transporter ATP-binding protein [Bacillota bacterium]
MLKVINFHKSYDKKEVVKGINLEVKPGEIFGFVGHNGAGKTTTIKSIVGILPFEKGTILIDGKDIVKNPVECKKVISYIPDNPDIYEHMTGLNYLKFIASIFEMDKDYFNKKVEELSKEFEIYSNLGDQIKSYSHGMKQKLVIISALMHNPKLLIFDEPFVGLDPKASFTLKKLMKELCSNGSSIFFSSHVLEVVEKLCDYVAIIKDGIIVVQGETEDILKDNKSLEDIFLELE